MNRTVFVTPAAFGIAFSLLASTLPDDASALTYGISLDADGPPYEATFEAPSGGGIITGFTVDINGVTFDQPSMGNDQPIYDEANNDIKGIADPIFGRFTNSVAFGPDCPALMCFLEFEDRVDMITPPVWAAFSVVSFDVFAAGFYFIDPLTTPVPLPSSLALLAGGLAMVGGVSGIRRRSRKG